jgi:flagellar hook assembly protein FlgD
VGSFVLRVAPKVFVPESRTTAYASFGSIFYQMNLSGTYGNMMIYDHRGRLIKQLLQNSSLDQAGVVIWDGTDVAGRQVQVGSYLIVLETYGPQQSRQIHHQTIVVGFHP